MKGIKDSPCHIVLMSYSIGPLSTNRIITCKLGFEPLGNGLVPSYYHRKSFFFNLYRIDMNH